MVDTSLVNQTPIPQRWVYFITSTRKEGLGILGTNPWHLPTGMSAEPMRSLRMVT